MNFGSKALCLILITAFFISYGTAFGQTSPADGPQEALAPPHLSTWRIGAVGGGTLASGVGLHLYQMNAWWAEDRGRFHVQNDWRYALWADKFGHAFAGTFITHLYSDLFQWSGLGKRTALWWGAGVGLTYLTYVEILDGFARNWGFSPGDQLFNTIGAGYPVLQHYHPPLQHVNLKVSYWPTGTPDKAIFDDYTGQTYWLTFNLHGLFPERNILPPWLNVTVGYAAREPDPQNFDFLSTSQLFVGLDLEPLALPIDHPLWNGIARWLHHIHLPAPALRLTPGVRFLPFAY